MQDYEELCPVEDNEIAHVYEVMPMCKASKDQGLLLYCIWQSRCEALVYICSRYFLMVGR